MLIGEAREAEAGYRKAIAAGNSTAWNKLGNLLAQRPGRGDEAEAAYRNAIQTGHSDGWLGLGNVFAAQPARKEDAEAAYREAIAAGVVRADVALGLLLAQQPGREREAEAAYRETIDSGATGRLLASAAGNLGELLARQGDVRGARAAFELYAHAMAAHQGVDMTDAAAARIARLRTAVARRPWALRLTRASCAATRPGALLGRMWQRMRRHTT